MMQLKRPFPLISSKYNKNNFVQLWEASPLDPRLERTSFGIILIFNFILFNPGGEKVTSFIIVSSGIKESENKVAFLILCVTNSYLASKLRSVQYKNSVNKK